MKCDSRSLYGIECGMCSSRRMQLQHFNNNQNSKRIIEKRGNTSLPWHVLGRRHDKRLDVHASQLEHPNRRAVEDSMLVQLAETVKSTP